MIRFALLCDERHEFESWFRDNAAFEDQSRRGLVSCPVCGSVAVEKAVMSPQVARTDKDRGSGPVAAPSEHALVAPAEAEIRTRLRELHAMLTQDSDYVGDKFADEARKIHYGEVEQRTIHGEADRDAVRSLLDDGIEVLPLPRLPDERN